MGELILTFLFFTVTGGVVSCIVLLVLLWRGRAHDEVRNWRDRQDAAEAVIDDLRDRLLDAQRELVAAKSRGYAYAAPPRPEFEAAGFASNGDDMEALQRRLMAVEDQLSRLRNALDVAEARAASAEQQLRLQPRASGSSGGTDKRFTDAKRAFARLYHPNSANGAGIEKVVRAEIFKEFWAELERIEAQGS